MKEITFFDFIDILRENKNQLKIRKMYCGYKKLFIEGIEIFKNKEIVVRVWFNNRIEKKFFDLDEFITKFLGKNKFRYVYNFLSLNIHSILFFIDIIKEVDNNNYLVKFFNRILKVKKFHNNVVLPEEFREKIVIYFLKDDDINKIKYPQIENDFDIVKELL